MNRLRAEVLLLLRATARAESAPAISEERVARGRQVVAQLLGR